MLTVEDVRQAADLFRPVYEDSAGRDGFVSLEVSPGLARDTAATVVEVGGSGPPWTGRWPTTSIICS
jgi:transaldolase